MKAFFALDETSRTQTAQLFLFEQEISGVRVSSVHHVIARQNAMKGYKLS